MRASSSLRRGPSPRRGFDVRDSTRTRRRICQVRYILCKYIVGARDGLPCWVDDSTARGASYQANHACGGMGFFSFCLLCSLAHQKSTDTRMRKRRRAHTQYSASVHHNRSTSTVMWDRFTYYGYASGNWLGGEGRQWVHGAALGKLGWTETHSCPVFVV